MNFQQKFMGKINWIMMLAAAALCLQGCRDVALSPEPEVEVPGGGIEDSATGWFAFTINETNPGTKADIHKEYDDDYSHYEWFNRGTSDERAIIDDAASNRVLFFNTDGSFYGSAKLTKVGTGKDNIFVGRQPSSVPVMPTRFLAVVNGDPARLDALDVDLDAAGAGALDLALNYLQELDPEDPESEAAYEGYLTMSSSMWQTEDDELIDGVLIKDDFHFFETREEALLPENLLTFHVERVVAKVTVRVREGELSFGKGDAIVLEGASKVKVRMEYQTAEGVDKDVISTWRANLASWGINGTEKNTYLFKRLEDNPSTSYPWHIGTQYYSRWSAFLLYRSYWAVDENYYTGFYPDQYRIALDEDGVEAGSTKTVYDPTYSSDEGLVQADYTLIYRSYEAFGTRADNKYAVENTYDEVVLSDEEYNTRPWLRCGTHVILTAQLIIDEVDKDLDLTAVDEHGFIKGVEDKYFSNGMYWSHKALIEQAVATLVSNIYHNNPQAPIRDVFTGEDVEFIDNDEKNPLVDNGPVVAEDGVAISADNAHDYFELTPAFIKGGDGWVTIRLKDGHTLSAKHADGTLTEITESQLVSYIYRFTNLARHFTEGRMYYALPIKHNVDSKNFEKGLEKVSTADYGFVRNHWYRLTINEVLLPGTPVDDPDQPIIPNNEPDDKSLGVNVEIIPWHIVDIHVDNLQ